MLHLLLRRDDDNNQYYDYSPALSAGIVFVVLFSLLTIANLAVVLKSRIWWTVVVVIGGVGEILGWAGRLWSAKNPNSYDAFIIQICCLIIAPCFFSAMLYGTTGALIRVVGPEFSLLGPSRFLQIFCTIDFISIVIQAAGGGLASSDNVDTSNTGTHVMVAGIVFQLVSMIVYSAVGIHFYLRARTARLNRTTSPADFHTATGVDALAARPVQVLAWSLALASLAIIIRGIYRTVELAQGWHGTAISHEVYTFVLDAVPMVFCMAFLLPAHPYFGLPNRGRTARAGSNAFSDDATVAELGAPEPKVSKQAA